MVTDEDDRDIHEGPFTIKIKLTSEMKKYNTFKLMCVNEDFSVGEPITLEVEGDYLVGTLEHLSLYTLVGSNVEQVPKTGDNIYTWVGILCISIIGLSIGMISLRKKVK